MRKKLFAVLLVMLMLAVSFGAAGCRKNKNRSKVNSFGNADNGIFLNADMTVVDCIYDDFDQSKYNDQEFAGFLQQDIDKYNGTHEFIAPPTQAAKDGETPAAPSVTVPISIRKCQASDNMLCQMRVYANAADFVYYNEEDIALRGGNTLQTGTLANLDQSILSASFVAVDKEPLDVQALASSNKAASYRYMLCNFEAYLYGEGYIVGYTPNGTYNESTNCVSCPAGQTVIVLFQD